MLAFLACTLPTIEENLALDEALLWQSEEHGGPEVLRIWEWPEYSVVLGAGGRFAEDVNEETCQADGVRTARRSSGGGTVLLGPGCLLFSLVLRYDRATELAGIASSFRWIMERIRAGLLVVAPHIEIAGTSDLMIEGRKFSGNAQQRKRDHFLHHGTLLYQFDLSRVGRYLHHPVKQPKYREGRDHTAFVCNLATDQDSLIAILRTIWNAEEPLHDLPMEKVHELCEEKYRVAEWTRRR